MVHVLRRSRSTSDITTCAFAFADRWSLQGSGGAILGPLLCRRRRRFRPSNHHTHGVATAQSGAFLSADGSAYIDADVCADPITDIGTDPIADVRADPGADRRTDLGADGACFIQFARGSGACGILVRPPGGCGSKSVRPRGCVGDDRCSEPHRFSDELWRVSSRTRKRRSWPAAVCFGDSFYGVEHDVSQDERVFGTRTGRDLGSRGDCSRV